MRGTAERTPAVVFFAYHRIHLFTFERLFERLAERGCRVVCAVFGEHVRNGQVEPELLRALEPRCRLVVLPKSPAERLVSRLLTRRFPGNSRGRRWARRGGRLLRSVAPVRAAVVPLHHPARLIRERVGPGSRFVAVQYEPFIQSVKVGRIASLEADLLCAWGELDADGLRRAGVRSPIAMTGSPLVDPVPRFDFEALSGRDRLRVLYTTTPLLHAPRVQAARELGFSRDDLASLKSRAVRDLQFLARRLPGLQVRIKLHPFDDGRLERQLLASSDGAGFEVVDHRPDVSIEEHIGGCDLLVTLSSTTAFQAVAAGKPAVFLNYDNWTGRHAQNYLAHGFALTAIDGPSLEWAVEMTRRDPATQEMLERNRAGYLARVASCWGDDAVEATCGAILGEESAAGPPPARQASGVKP